MPPCPDRRTADFGPGRSGLFRPSAFGRRISGFGLNAPLALALVLAFAGAAACAQSNRIPGPQDYASFSKFITDRNIFDPSRQPHYYDPNRRFTHHPRPHGTPGIQLVGTMSYDKGMFAFFNGNSSELSKVLQVGNKIVDYTITEIMPSFVLLESADKKEQSMLKIGGGFRQENGKWVLAGEGDLSTASSAPETAGSSSGASASDTSAAPASTGEPNDILKRLMQQREKENQ